MLVQYSRVFQIVLGYNTDTKVFGCRYKPMHVEAHFCAEYYGMSPLVRYTIPIFPTNGNGKYWHGTARRGDVIYLGHLCMYEVDKVPVLRDIDS